MLTYTKVTFLLALLNLGNAAPLTAPASGCPAVTIITARASTEAAGEGITGTIAAAIQSMSTQTVARYSVSYPATLTNYAASAASGVAALKSQLTTLVNACPSSKFVLLGYSQGSHVIGDVLAGGGGGNLGTAQTPAIGTAYSSKVVAAVLFGDPRHVDGEVFQKGTDKNGLQGLFPRPAAISLAPFNNILASYCDNNDEFCASGLSLAVHLGYITEYGTVAENFVLSKIGG